ncbi:hypothetical protein LY76DRAFT_607314 [Colletotrichum caudatum]|nr:hypothetical protein LY76DRAFT_607314 [Colletotrichum caudatum]
MPTTLSQRPSVSSGSASFQAGDAGKLLVLICHLGPLVESLLGVLTAERLSQVQSWSTRSLLLGVRMPLQPLLYVLRRWLLALRRDARHPSMIKHGQRGSSSKEEVQGLGTDTHAYMYLEQASHIRWGCNRRITPSLYLLLPFDGPLTKLLRLLLEARRYSEPVEYTPVDP